MFGRFFRSDEQLLAQHQIALDPASGTVSLGKFGIVRHDQITRLTWSKRSRGGSGMFDRSGRASVKVEFREPADRIFVVSFAGAHAERDAEELHGVLKRQLHKTFE